MRLRSGYPTLATTLLLACAAPTTVRSPEPAGPGVVDDEGGTPMDYARLNKTLHGLPEVRRLLVGGAERGR